MRGVLGLAALAAGGCVDHVHLPGADAGDPVVHEDPAPGEPPGPDDPGGAGETGAGPDAGVAGATDGSATSPPPPPPGATPSGGGGGGQEPGAEPEPPPRRRCLVAFPRSLDFGSVGLGAYAEREVTVSNCGDAAATVTSLAVGADSSPAFLIGWPLPRLDLGCTGDPTAACQGEALLPTWATASFTVRYTPAGEGRDEGRAVLTTDAPGQETLEVALVGRSYAGPAEDGLHVELVWDSPADPDRPNPGPGWCTDLDLHLLREPGGWSCAPEDVWAGHPRADWGEAGVSEDDPVFSRDDTDGDGPENVTLGSMEAGATYRIGVHYRDDCGFAASFATVRVFVSGVLRFELANKRLPATGSFWDVARVDGGDGRIQPINRLHRAPPDPSCGS